MIQKICNLIKNSEIRREVILVIHLLNYRHFVAVRDLSSLTGKYSNIFKLVYVLIILLLYNILFPGI